MDDDEDLPPIEQWMIDEFMKLPPEKQITDEFDNITEFG